MAQLALDGTVLVRNNRGDAERVRALTGRALDPAGGEVLRQWHRQGLQTHREAREVESMIHSRRVTALIPIKDHSARVAGKNFREFAGQPLYHHILQTLDRTYAVDEIVIDTDSYRVMQEAPRLSPKIRVIERPAELRGDAVSTNRLFAYDLSQTTADIYVQTHSTNPLLRSETIARALKTFVESEDYDSLFTVNRCQSRFYLQDGTPVNHDPENLIPTQDLSPVYEENSCLYVFTKESFAKRQRRIGLKPLMFPTPPMESVDIDDEFAFRLAEMLALYADRTPR